MQERRPAFAWRRGRVALMPLASLLALLPHVGPTATGFFHQPLDPATATYRFESPAILAVDFDSRILGENADELRSRMDADGSQFIDAGEVGRAEAEYKEIINRSGRALGVPGANFTVDGHEPSAFNATGAAYVDAEGPVTGGVTIRFSVALTARYKVGPASNHSVSIRPQTATTGGSWGLNITAAILKAPPGYQLRFRDEAVPGIVLSRDKNEARFLFGMDPAMDTVNLLLVPQSPGTAASSFVATSVAVLMVAALVCSRRDPP